MSIRLDYDDNIDVVIGKINDELQQFCLQLECDDLEHDGFMIYELVQKDI